MSGIAGIIRFDGGPVETGLIEQMTGAMPYRGPDGISHWARGSVALGQCSMQTTRESLEETLPLANEDESLVLVMDGWLSNWEELRAELLAKGARLRTRGDAELVLRAYETWGRDCLARIDGDFSFVIWDVRQNEAFCARDRMGIKPFVYHWDGRRLTFASELHAILAMPWVRQEPNLGMVAEIISDEWFSHDETLWTGVMRLPGSQRMRVGASGPKTEQYWQPELWKTLPYSRDEDYIEHYRELLTDVVRRHSRSHVRVAYEVSGGLDSSAVFCLAESLRKAGQPPAPGIDGYTLAYRGDAEADELSYAHAVGAHLGLTIEEVAPAFPELSWYADRARVYRDFPGFPNCVHAINMYNQVAAKGSRVLITGLGGDQFVTGNNAFYAEEILARRWRLLYGCLAANTKAFGLGATAGSFICEGLLPLSPAFLKDRLGPIWRRMTKRAGRGAFWLSPKTRGLIAARRSKHESAKGRNVRTRGQVQLLRNANYGFDAFMREQCEQLCASTRLELRHPYYSAKFIEFALATPERLRKQGRISKYIHTEALKGVLPEIIRTRTTKADFESVFALRLKVMEDFFTTDLVEARSDWLDRDGMRQLFQAYIDSPQDGWQSWILWGAFASHVSLR